MAVILEKVGRIHPTRLIATIGLTRRKEYWGEQRHATTIWLEVATAMGAAVVQCAAVGVRVYIPQVTWIGRARKTTAQASGGGGAYHAHRSGRGGRWITDAVRRRQSEEGGRKRGGAMPLTALGLARRAALCTIRNPDVAHVLCCLLSLSKDRNYHAPEPVAAIILS